MAGPTDAEILEIGRSIHDALPAASRSPLKALDAKAMDFATADADLRAALFRFVNVVPACRSVDDVVAHLSGFLDEVDERPPPLDVAMRMGSSRAGPPGARARRRGRRPPHGAPLHRRRVRRGRDPPLTGLWRDGIASSVDLLGEATVTPREAEHYAARCADALEALTAVYRPLPEQPLLEHDAAGPLPRANLSVKVSALTPLLRPDAPERGKRDAGPRLRELLRIAKRLGAHLHIDMESYDSREAVVELVLELLSEPEFADGPSAGIVLQAYLRDAPDTLDVVESWARATPRASPLVVRLVKGAYWDHEVVEARQHGWNAPVFEEKAESDRAFERLTVRLLDMRPLVRVAIASHNLRSVAHAIAANRAAARRTTTSSCRSCAGSATTSGRPSRARGFASAPTARSATWCPAWPTSCGGSSRTPRTSPSSPPSTAARPSRTLRLGELL